MTTLSLLSALIAAPIVGSFLSVVVLRLPRQLPIAWDRSRCPHCRHNLAPRDLVPIVSWLVAAGRCRYCAGRISLLYPGLELAALAVTAWAAIDADDTPIFWASCGLAWCLVALAAIDARDGLLPDALTLPLTVAGLAVTYALAPSDLLAHIIGAAAGYLCFWGLARLYQRLRGHEGLGLGDAKLLAAAGAWVSWQGLPSVVLVAALSTLGWALVAQRLRGGLTRRTRIPFGPGLCAGFWLIWLYGPLG